MYFWCERGRDHTWLQKPEQPTRHVTDNRLLFDVNKSHISYSTHSRAQFKYSRGEKKKRKEKEASACFCHELCSGAGWRSDLSRWDWRDVKKTSQGYNVTGRHDGRRVTWRVVSEQHDISWKWLVLVYGLKKIISPPLRVCVCVCVCVCVFLNSDQCMDWSSAPDWTSTSLWGLFLFFGWAVINQHRHVYGPWGAAIVRKYQ